MPHVAIDSLKAALKSGTPDRVYLFFGDNDFLKDEAARDLVEALIDSGTRDFNLDIVRGGDTDPGSLSTALDALPMLAARRVVVVRELSALKKASRAVLDRYLENPSSESVVVLVAPAAWKAEASIVKRSSAVEFPALTGKDVLLWVDTRAKVLGSAIEPEAAKVLVTATGTDLATLDGELRKLRDYASGGAISVDAVRAIVGVSEGHTTTDLIDLVCSRDGSAASALVTSVLSQPKASAVGLVMALTTHILGIGQVLVDRGNRVSQRQQATNLYAMMGEARSAPVARPWGEAVAAMMRHADRWDFAAVDRALGLLVDADSSLKDSGISSDDGIIGTLVLMLGTARVPSTRAA